MLSHKKPDVWLDDDGIICVRFPRNTKITLELISYIYHQHKAISNQHHPVLFYVDGVVHYDVAAADFATHNEVVSITSALALLGSGFLSTHLGNMLIWYHKPPFPVKMFTDETKARHWLADYC